MECQIASTRFATRLHEQMRCTEWTVSLCMNDYLRVHDWLFLTKVDRAAS